LRDIILRHRNIIVLNINPDAAPGNVALFDQYAVPQIILTITAPDAKGMGRYLSENRDELLTLFNGEERKRSIKWIRSFNNPTLERTVRDMFGINMNIPANYSRRIAGENFLWMIFEDGVTMNNLLIYSWPYTGAESFSEENLLERRAEFVSRINGPRYPDVDSHMITSPYFDTQLRYLRIDGRPWAELRGWWEMANDFMGGPFVSFSTLDASTNRVITIEGVLYAPQKSKRNNLRTMEHFVHTVTFPQ
jgi:hypothetical protein